MNKEQLIALGLTEEQADKVLEGFDNEHMIPKSRLDDKNTEIKGLKDQLEQRDKDLKDLKKQAEGNEDLQKQYDDLQKQYKADKTEYETKIKDTQLNSALKIALNGKVHDNDLVAGLIDKEKIELSEDGNITKGLDEQIKTLQESKSFLFVSEDDGMPTVKGAKPADGINTTNQKNEGGSFGEQLAKESSENNKGLEEARQSYFN